MNSLWGEVIRGTNALLRCKAGKGVESELFFWQVLRSHSKLGNSRCVCITSNVGSPSNILTIPLLDGCCNAMCNNAPHFQSKNDLESWKDGTISFRVHIVWPESADWTGTQRGYLHQQLKVLCAQSMETGASLHMVWWGTQADVWICVVQAPWAARLQLVSSENSPYHGHLCEWHRWFNQKSTKYL